MIQATAGSLGGVGRLPWNRSGWVANAASRTAAPLFADGGGGAVVDRGWGVEPDPGVAVLVVVVIEEGFAERSGVFDAAEGSGERRAVLEGLERGFAVGVVVGDVGAAVAAVDAEVDEELGDRLGGHRCAPVGVQGERVLRDALLEVDTFDEVLGERAGLGVGERPADDVAGEDVDDDVELVVLLAGRAPQLGDVPRPNLVGFRGDQFGFLLGWVGALPAPFAALSGGTEKPPRSGFAIKMSSIATYSSVARASRSAFMPRSSGIRVCSTR